MKKIITSAILITLLLLAGASVQAQQLPAFKMQIRGGVNFAKITGDQESDIGTGYSAGIGAHYHFPSHLGLSVPSNLYLTGGVDFTVKNSVNKLNVDIKNPQTGTISSARLKTDYSPMYIQVPIHIGYRIQLPIEKTLVKVKLSVGPYIAYGVGGKIKAETIENDIKIVKKSVDFFDKTTIDRLDYGVGAKVGLELSGFEISGGYDFGLANVAKVGELKNKNLFVTLGLRFL